MKNSDILATGSADDYLNLYKYSDQEHTIEKIKRIPLVGSINAMQFSGDGNTLICAQAPDQRLGRWITNKSVKSGITIFTNVIPAMES